MRGAPYDIEHRIVVVGALKWVRERAEVEFDTDGRAVEGIGTVQDITERKRAQEELLRINRAHRALSSCNEALDPRHGGIRLARSGLPHHRRRGGLSLLLGGPCGTRRGEDRDGRGAGRSRRGLPEGRQRDLGRHRPRPGTDGDVHPDGTDADREEHGHRSDVRPVARRGAEARLRLDDCDSARRRRRAFRSAEYLRGGGRSVPRRRSDAVERVGRRPGLRRHDASRPSRAAARRGGDPHAECRARAARPRTNRRPRSRPRA